MRLKLTVPKNSPHKELVGAVGWNVWNELFSCSDDHTVQRWNMHGDLDGKVCSVEAYFTDLHWYPVSSKKQQAGGSDVFAVACTDGTVKIVSRSGRMERSIDAHKGAVLSIRWSSDGTAFATGGEDGTVKVWSRNGMLRSTLAQLDSPVYGVAWSGDCDQVLHCYGSQLAVKSMQASSKQNSWKAHDGVVLKADWSAISGLIVSGGEDCRYKVWDSYGRLMYQSAPLEQPVTSVAWCPSGDLFAAGSFECLLLCDRMGWAYSKVRANVGSLLSLSWTPDGTQVAAAGGNGAVCFGQLVDEAHEDGRMHVQLVDEKKIVVHDILSETREELEFRDRVVKMSLGYGYLVVATSSQCQVFSTSNWNTPHIFDLRDNVTLIKQCDRSFLMIDASSGIQLYSYEGRPMCQPKAAGLRTDFLSPQTIAVAFDALAVVDQASTATIRFFDTAQGKPMGEPYVHALEVQALALNTSGNLASRHLVFVDRNRDLYILNVMKRAVAKLAPMVDSVVWHGSTNMLSALSDLKLCVWYYPDVVFEDKALLPATRYVKADSDFGKGAVITVFANSKVHVRRGDGVAALVSVSPYPLTLYGLVRKGQWDKALRLCRFTADPSLWACLAAMAMNHRELATAEAAFAAIDEVDRLRFVSKLRQIPTEEGRSAELALYRRRPDEAEAILLQAGLVYRAIKMRVKLCDWERALQLAQANKQHVDTVLMYRSRYLAACGQRETLTAFVRAGNEVHVDEASVRAAIQAEKANEASRPGAKRYVPAT